MDQKSKWDGRISQEIPGCGGIGVGRRPVQVNRPQAVRQSEVSREITKKAEVKEREVLVKVFDPGRLLEAWQQVWRNAGAAGIDQSVPA